MNIERLVKSPCHDAEIRREYFDDAMQGFCEACGKEVDRTEHGHYKITALKPATQSSAPSA